MKIVINAFGTRGDVQPYVALGKGLREAGHEVHCYTHPIFETLVREHGLGFCSNGIDPRQVLVSQAVADLGNNPFRVMHWITENFKPVLDHLFQATLTANEGADLILNSSLSFAGYHVAQKLNVPALAVYLQPMTPTRAFPGMSAPVPPSWLPFKGAYNYLTTKLTNQTFFHALRSVTNACRAEVFDLPPLSARYYWQIDAATAKTHIIYGYSASVVPKPPDWTENQQVVGYWFLDQSRGYEPPAALVDFLKAGPPPVSVGFGSMVDHERQEMNRIVTDAIRQSRKRAVLLGGWSNLGSNDLPDDILRIDSAPHDWLFPQMAAVVHHGGAGTTAAGLRAGVPTVIVPFFGDQHFWGWRAHALGVGPKWIPRKKLTADKLADAIRQAVNDAGIRGRAAALSERIRAEDGIGNGVRWVERFAGL